MTEFLDSCLAAIKAQEKSIADTLKNVDIERAPGIAAKRQVILVGAGDSYGVADFGRWVLLSAGVSAHSVSPTEIAYIPLDSECVIIGVTASGRSLSTLDAIRTARAHGASIIVLTDDPNGRAAKEASDVWVTKAGVQSYNVSPASPTTTAMAYLLKIASELNGQFQRDLKHDVNCLSKPGREMLAWAEQEGTAISNMISSETPLYIISDGPNYAAAQIGMMKFNEFSILKGVTALREEFCHHHALSIGEREQGILISTDPPSASDRLYLGVLSDTLKMRMHHLHSDLGLRTALAQAIPNTIALQMAAHYTVRRFKPDMEGFKMPHAKAFQIY